MWNRELTELLILKYKHYEHLYNKRHPDYTDKLQRSITLHNIYLDLEEKCPNITLNAIKIKLHTLRSQFVKEMRKVLISKTHGEPYEPTLWFFDQLQFLKPYCSARKSMIVEGTEYLTDTLSMDHDEDQSATSSNENENTEISMESYNERKPETLSSQIAISNGWTRDWVKELILKYKEHENLYNGKSRYYFDKKKRSESFFKIYTDLKEKNPNITVDVIKTKVHTLRSQYAKERREMYKRKTNDYKPRLWCFDQLTFLNPHCTTRKSYSNIYHNDNSIQDSSKSETSVDEKLINGNEEYTFGNQHSNDNFIDMEFITNEIESNEIVSNDSNKAFSDRATTPSSSEQAIPASKKRRYQIDMDENESKKTDKKDRHNIFGEYVASELRSLDVSPDLQFKLKKSIQQLIIDITSEQASRLYGTKDEQPQQESLT